MAFYAMKLVSGKRLDELLREGLPLRERLRLLLRICEPVAFAHAHGVIHRDLKPGNVMVGPFGEVLVMDWGVAKHRGEPLVAGGAADPPAGSAPDATAHGTIVGTPAYMSPEQARGEVERIDARSDVYALGAILYFMLTGRAPGRLLASAEAPTRTWAGPRQPGVAPGIAAPRELVPELARPLEAICLKALAFEPDGRYAGAAELASDLGRYLEGDQVSSRRTASLSNRSRGQVEAAVVFCNARARGGLEPSRAGSARSDDRSGRGPVACSNALRVSKAERRCQGAGSGLELRRLAA